MISGTIICGNSMMPLVRGGKIFGIYTSVSRACDNWEDWLLLHFLFLILFMVSLFQFKDKQS